MKNDVTVSVTIAKNGSLAMTLEELERHLIATALDIYPNRTAAAKALGIGRSTLYRKIEEYDLCPERQRERRLKEQLQKIAAERAAFERTGTLLVPA